MGQFNLDDLKLAFCMHMVDQIVAADDTLSPDELAFFEQKFPSSMLQERGFVGPDGVRTNAWHLAAMDALDRLPTELSEPEKVDLLSVFFAATVADDQFELSEGNLLLAGARLLDLDDAVVDAFLASRSEAGGVTVQDLDDLTQS